MKNNLFNILLTSKSVNTYTKVLIILNILSFNNDFYIPNTKLINILKKYDININKRELIYILQKLYSDKHITLNYLGNKRYFSLNFYNKKKNKEEEDYNWLNADLN